MFIWVIFRVISYTMSYLHSAGSSWLSSISTDPRNPKIVLGWIEKIGQLDVPKKSTKVAEFAYTGVVM